MPALSIIIPCYNEEKRLPVEHLYSFLINYADTRLILVNDCSTDRTLELITGFATRLPNRVAILDLTKKSGKAEAVRSGMLESIKDPHYTHHGYIDADLAVAPEELHRLYLLMKSAGYKFILGSRIKKIGANIERSICRHFYGRIIATVVDAIVSLGVYDTQCSAKILVSQIIQPVFGKPFLTKWLFDVELISRIRSCYGNLGESGTEEPVLNWSEKKGSKLKLYHFASILTEIFIIKRNYSHKR